MSELREPSDSVRTQLNDALSALTPASRIITAVLGVLVIVGIVLLARGKSDPQRELLFGGRSLSEQELDSVEMSFSRSGLNDWVRDGRRISIPVQNRSDYLSTLQEASSLPLSMRSNVQDAIDKTTIFESSSQRLAREMHAKQQDLGDKLAAFPEIRWASVEYDVGERQGLSRTRKQSASVVVCPEGIDQLSSSRIQTIQEFIRGSYAGMNREDVVVIDTNANEDHCHDPLLRQQLEHQARLEQQIRDILSGYGPIQVATYVDLEKTVPTTPIAQTPTAAKQTKESDEGLFSRVIQSVTHVRSNRPTRLDEPSPTSQTKSEPAHIASQPMNRSDAQAVNGSIVVRGVRATIGLPESYYQKVWELSYRRQHGQRQTQQIPGIQADQLQRLIDQTKANITAAVTPVMYAAHRSNSPAIDVWTYPDLPNGVTDQADFATMSFSWLNEHWQQASLVLMGFIGLCVVLSNFRSSSKQQHLASNDKPAINQPANTPTTTPAITPKTNWDNDSNQAELLALIDQNPDAAADVIRDWIAEAA